MTIFKILLFFSIISYSYGCAEYPVVNSEEGNIPLLLTAPHGGYATYPDIKVRTSGNILQDTHTLEILDLTVKNMQKYCHKKPYFVMALFHRKYVDANRDRSIAYEDPKASAYYDRYHKRILQYKNQILKRFHRGLLIDIHGQSQEPNVIFRGTKNLRTVQFLINQYGNSAIMGPYSIWGQLKQKGYTIYPDSIDGTEDRRFNGGYTTQTYYDNQFSTMQIEIGKTYRKNEKDYTQFADDFAQALCIFYRHYLSK